MPGPSYTLMPMRRLILFLAATVVLGVSCSTASVPVEDIADLPITTPSDIRALLAESTQPVVLNVWASWCIPCRSEAPLLREAHAEFGGEVRFVGLDVEDGPDAAREFIAEFGLDGFEHYADPSGAVRADLAGRGVPLTYFFAAGGELIELHQGVIDERGLALGIDELLRRGG